ncbi:purine-binding chemotaxis protein CheW [Lutibacter sp. B2]|nr:purine-binding chemotaxis protein CheW [Lutibacter sp. B2]
MSEKQYVIFKLGNEVYGVDIMNVKEITEDKEIVMVPDVPDFIEGMINLRGNIIPIVNLKKKFNVKSDEINCDTRVIVISIKNQQVGFIVDEASQVLRINEENIEPPPDLIVGPDKKYIIGVGKIESGIVLLLELEYILSEEEKNQVKEMVQQ